MTSRERVLSCLARKGYDRLPVKHVAVPPINELLMERLSAATPDALLARLGDDFRWVEAEYRGPELRRFEDGTVEGLWGERHSTRHNAAGVFQDIV